METVTARSRARAAEPPNGHDAAAQRLDAKLNGKLKPLSRRATARARVTNHIGMLPDVDGNSAAARRFRDLVGDFIADLGGLEMCSTIKLGLIRRLAAVTVQVETLEAKVINGQPVEAATLCQLASTALRLSQRLGLERVAREVKTPRLADLLQPQRHADG